MIIHTLHNKWKCGRSHPKFRIHFQTSSQWLKDNKVKLNPDKCHLILNGKGNRGVNVGNVVIKNSRNEKLLGVFFNEASFGYHIENVYKG